ncbi:hypothetical protein [Pyrodictium abyssi]|uniref:Uncharacterized protein n=1 Tax=Pyrodictium abyssi TaxID=54256 RepID=A0ABM8IXG1_9CREN|nr:hypothetical protein PABY_17760 [Pyrodictium abyssi]
MTGSGVLLGYTLPCRRRAALDLIERLERSLRAERASAGLFAVLFIAVPALLMPYASLSPLGARLLTLLFALGAAGSGATIVSKTLLLRRLQRLRQRLEELGSEELPESLCSVELRELLSRAGAG